MRIPVRSLHALAADRPRRSRFDQHRRRHKAPVRPDGRSRPSPPSPRRPSGPDDPFVCLDLATTVRVNEQARRHRAAVGPAAARWGLGPRCSIRRRSAINLPNAVRLDAGHHHVAIRTRHSRASARPQPGRRLPVLLLRPAAAVRSTVPTGCRSCRGLSARGSGQLVRYVVGRAGRHHRRHAGALSQVFGARTLGPARSSSRAAASRRRPVCGSAPAFAHGPYRQASDADYYGLPDDGPVADADATAFNLEAEYAFRYTRLSGEWVRDALR